MHSRSDLSATSRRLLVESMPKQWHVYNNSTGKLLSMQLSVQLLGLQLPNACILLHAVLVSERRHVPRVTVDVLVYMFVSFMYVRSYLCRASERLLEQSVPEWRHLHTNLDWLVLHVLVSVRLHGH